MSEATGARHTKSLLLAKHLGYTLGNQLLQNNILFPLKWPWGPSLRTLIAQAWDSMRGLTQPPVSHWALEGAWTSVHPLRGCLLSKV